MRSLPFYIDDLNGGFMFVEGILRMEGRELHFEFQKKDAVFEAYKSDLKTAVISIDDLDMTEFKKGWVTGKLILHAQRAAQLEALPGDELVQRTLKIKRKNRELAANISSRLNLMISEKKLTDMEGDQE